MRRTWLWIFVLFLWVSPAFGQRDAPVYESYLPQFSIYHDNINGRNGITIDLLFKKNGGPVEHTEHQAYILVYLKKDEEQILKLAGDSELVDKRKEKSGKTFLEMLIDKKLVAPLESQVAKRNSPNGRHPKFADVRGYPRATGSETLADHSFPFKFTFAYETLIESVRKLGHFSPQSFDTVSKSKWFKDQFKFIVFVPVNNSAHANKVSREIHESWDFAYSMDSFTALLYFKPLPYELTFHIWDEKLLSIYIN